MNDFPVSAPPGKYLIRPGELIHFMAECSLYVPPMLEELARNDIVAHSSVMERKTTEEPAILVVDDDPVMRQLTSRTLAPLGLPVIPAEDGFDALHQLTKNPRIALVILDLVMPGQGGGKTFEQIRDIFPTLPVIICTGQAQEEAEAIFQNKKPDLILTKPYQPSHLASAAAAFLADLGL